jgi:NADPH-dependent 2,4-dienoyl-CoA reductase/sulfur reductase-like enzyme
VHVVLLGNGIAALTAAQTLRSLRPDWRITMVGGESSYPYSRPALMYIHMGHLRYADTKLHEDAWYEDRRIERVRAWVTGLDPAARRLEMHGGGTVPFDRLLVATGSRTRPLGIPGEDLEGVQGLIGLMDLARLRENTRDARRAVIIGGGLIGIELAEMLRFQGIAVTMLVRESGYWGSVLPPEESSLVNEVVAAHGIELRLSTEAARIEGDGRGRVAAVVTTAGERIACELVGVTAGVVPNVAVVRAGGLACDEGVLVDAGLRTGVDGILAAGDCAQIRADGSDHVQKVWYSARRQGEVAGRVLAGEEARYQPGIWFNSAKFLSLEYQTYGRADRTHAARGSLVWVDRARRQAVRVVHEDGRVVGFNFLGLRFRHRVCEAWIEEGAAVRTVLDDLDRGWFDPELFPRRSGEIADALRARWREAAA